MSTSPHTEPGRDDSVAVSMARLLLAAAEHAGADRRALVRVAGLSETVLADDEARITVEQSMRLWEAISASVAHPHVGLRIADFYRPGMLDLFDYLFTSAATLGDGLQLTSRYMHLVGHSWAVDVTSRDGTVTVSHRALHAEDRVRALAGEFSLGVLLNRARRAAGRPVTPLAIGFDHPAPPNRGAYVEAFGTERIDFGLPATTFTLSASDLDLPLRGADPALAAVLRRYAATFSPAAPITTWQDRLRRLIGDHLADGTATLEVIAGELAMSPRTLQRRLAESGTTWRQEIDAVREEHARTLLRENNPGKYRLAASLGYSDTRALRRAMRRWSA
ncbi:AraC family transcriptional regulator ligand-binding domain-containing protein [Actinoallomurus purpureus]|uniref:AraC family transcriptional regulator n=1 Tax=Actinoallomurus purpureus TaxID=478114 RepID=UPI0020928BF3|nr:AraC family transcriptional regulator [Actinoallomurus purpureus]MCO6006146.1 AraC family transcriptional regulator ligand-binding domain-containing protein [Actinoallomurus purpureus]